MIQYFKVNGLYGTKNVCLKFAPTVTVIVGMNGSGKTTLLNMLHCCLDKQRLFKLKRYEFESIEIKFNDKADGLLILHRDDLNGNPEADCATELNDIHGAVHFQPNQNVTTFCQQVDQQLTDIDEILFLPTFRRVEANRAQLDVDFSVTKKMRPAYPDEAIAEYAKKLNMEHMSFGLEDIEQKLTEISAQLDRKIVASYHAFNANILNAILSNQVIQASDLDEVYQYRTAFKDIILKRLDDAVDPSNLKKMEAILDNQDELQQNKPLSYVLIHLLKAYKTHQRLENSLLRFADVANTYLNDKQFSFNKNLCTLDIKTTDNTSLTLADLSSGEQQIISIMFYLYFNDHKKIVMMDEPERSLATEWQEHILTDIVQSKHCQFLIAATHSPYILGKAEPEPELNLRRHLTMIESNTIQQKKVVDV
jgi:predicted ATP-binding protein involved in virulence